MRTTTTLRSASSPRCPSSAALSRCRWAQRFLPPASTNKSSVSDTPWSHASSLPTRRSSKTTFLRSTRKSSARSSSRSRAQHALRHGPSLSLGWGFSSWRARAS
eukprot:Amastigsp_a678233_1028.p3 type:complete len:104 gc:universal Amastigsp_a678233_1028:819-508(-)